MSSTSQVGVVESWTRQNIGVIEGGVAVLQKVDATRYTTQHEAFGAASVGEHVRHCIEFYECFLAGLAPGHVDYDARRRDTRLEHDCTHALARWRELMVELRELPRSALAGDGVSHGLRVKLDRPEVGGPPPVIVAAADGDVPDVPGPAGAEMPDVPVHAGAEMQEVAWASSTIERELQFLASHTVHHFTVIALLLRLDGVEVDADFGVAPSTLHHRRTSSTAH